MEDTAKPPVPDENWAGDLLDMVEFAGGGIVSKTICNRPKVNISLYAMSTGETMSGHAATRPATIHVLDGEGDIQIGETVYQGKRGSLYYMPAKQYHALTSTDNLVFLLYLFN
jgi:quercetin dioxygenase-like cupin family protein